jgi:hypothetical protein
VKTPPVTPYLLPPDEAVHVGAWLTDDGTELSDRLEHWDPFLDLDLVRVVEVDLDAVRAACRLDDESAFILAASWHSNRTRIAGHGPGVVLSTLGGLVRASVTLSIPGADAGGRVDLRTRLVLGHPGREPSTLSPQRVGATLWEDQVRIAFEGAAARFPVAAVEFGADSRFPEGAAWALEWDPDDLETPVMGGLRLLVNSGHSGLLEALASGAADPRAGTIRSFAMFDVARSLVRGALANDRFVDARDTFAEDSIGRMISDLLTRCWPGIPAAALRARAVESPARLDAELQAHLGLLG